MVSVAVACLPAAVSLLLLAVLFMQISGVSLALTWPCRLCLLRVLLCVSLCYKLSPFQAQWERWHCPLILRPACLFTVHVRGRSSPLFCGIFLPPPLSQAFLLLITGWCCYSCQLPSLFTVHVRSGSSLLSCGVFLPLPLSQAFPLLVAGHAPHSRQSLSGLPGLFIYSLGRIPFPQSLVLSAPHPLSHVSLLFLLLITQFLFFFPRWRSVCPGGYADWPRLVCGSTVVPRSSPGPHLPMPSGRRQLVAWGPSWFLRLTWSGDSLCRLEVWRGQNYVSSQWLCLQSVSPASLQDFTIGGSLSASSL
jgi:hypothetical protein